MWCPRKPMEKSFEGALEGFNGEFSKMGRNMEILGSQFAEISKFVELQESLFRTSNK